MGEREIAERIEQRLFDNESFRRIWQEVVGRDPRYRYWQTADGRMFIFTTERMGDGKFASAIYVPAGKGSRSGKKHVTRWVVRREVHHATRRAAKARAYKLYTDHRAEIAA